MSIKKYFINETSLSLELKLSNYNKLGLLYFINTFHGAPNPTYGMQLGDVGTPESSFGFSFTHHLDTKSTIIGTMYMIDGYFINTTSGDFRIFSGENQVLYSSLITDLWISHTLKLKFRVSHTSDPLLTNAVGVYPAGSADVESEVINFPTIYKSSTDFTFNLDYVF